MTDSKTTIRYQQIYQTIRDEIVRGNYRPGEKLPTSAGFWHDSGRQSDRRASDRQTGQDGLIRRRQGSGTYIQRIDRPHGAKPTLTFFAPFVECNEELPHVESLIVRHLAELDRKRPQCGSGSMGSDPIKERPKNASVPPPRGYSIRTARRPLLSGRIAAGRNAYQRNNGGTAHQRGL